jgi:hypothetical protein
MRRVMKRRALILTVVGLAAVFAAPAAAQKPERTILPPYEDAVSNRCGFPVSLHDEGTIIHTEFKDGRVAEVYPGYRTTLTNLNTGESLVAIIPGPWLIDGSTQVGTGPWLFGINPETDEPGFFLVRGRWVETDEGLTFVGHVVDLCAELAPG